MTKKIMDKKTAEILCKINSQFYQEQGSSFSETRKAGWPGWDRLVSILKGEGFLDAPSCSVFDFACGNLRFENYLSRAVSQVTFDFYGVDNCDLMIPESHRVHYQHLDIVQALLQDRELSHILEAPLCDLSACFGFMHHVPTTELREQVLATLLDRTQAEGYAAVSFWQFLKDRGMAKKAEDTTARGRAYFNLPFLDEGDCLLGWKNTTNTYRYCHSFSEEEIDSLITFAAGKASPIARFTADGRTKNLNTYVVFKHF